MKIAVSSYSFMGAIRDGRMGIMDVIPKAKQMGFEGVEIANIDEVQAEIISHAARLRAQSQEYGMPIAAYLTGADFLANDLDTEVDRLRGQLEIAKALGTPRMRHDACWTLAPGAQFDDVLPRLIEGYRRVTEIGEAMGIATMIENHGFVTQDSDRVERVVTGVGSSNFGWLVDMGNFLCADEDPEHAVSVGVKHCVHAHAKDFHIKPADAFAPENGWFGSRGGNHLRGAIFGHGNMNARGCVDILKDAGYNGWISLEFEGMEDCLLAVEEGYKNLKSML